jgi:hypothetical protein
VALVATVNVELSEDDIRAIEATARADAVAGDRYSTAMARNVGK